MTQKAPSITVDFAGRFVEATGRDWSSGNRTSQSADCKYTQTGAQHRLAHRRDATVMVVYTAGSVRNQEKEEREKAPER